MEDLKNLVIEEREKRLVVLFFLYLKKATYKANKFDYSRIDKALKDEFEIEIKKEEGDRLNEVYRILLTLENEGKVTRMGNTQYCLTFEGVLFIENKILSEPSKSKISELLSKMKIASTDVAKKTVSSALSKLLVRIITDSFTD